MRKSIVRLLMAAAAVACVAGPAAAKDFTIGLSWNAKDSILVQKWEDYLQAQGREQGKAAGIDFKWVINVANADPTRQAANIEDLINQGVDLIMARAEDGAAIGSSIKAAQAAGIPFVTFDRASSTTKPTAHVGGDSYDQGKTTAEAMVALLKDKGVHGKCIELRGQSDGRERRAPSQGVARGHRQLRRDRNGGGGADGMEPRAVPLRHGERAARPPRGQLHVPGQRLCLVGGAVAAGGRRALRQDRRSQAHVDRHPGRVPRRGEGHGGQATSTSAPPTMRSTTPKRRSAWSS